MRYIKMLGLLAVAATALAAFAATASAVTVTTGEGATPTLKTTSTNWELDGSFTTIDCTHSFLSWKVESHGAGKNVSGKVSSLTFTGCNYEVVVEAAGSLEIESSHVVRSTGATIKAFTSVGTCDFSTNFTNIGTLTDSNQTKGTAVHDINSAKVPRTSGNFLCGSSGTMTGSYSVESPDSVIVD